MTSESRENSGTVYKVPPVLLRHIEFVRDLEDKELLSESAAAGIVGDGFEKVRMPNEIREYLLPLTPANYRIMSDRLKEGYKKLSLVRGKGKKFSMEASEKN